MSLCVLYACECVISKMGYCYVCGGYVKWAIATAVQFFLFDRMSFCFVVQFLFVFDKMCLYLCSIQCVSVFLFLCVSVVIR